jgi:hypothetical protein
MTNKNIFLITVILANIQLSYPSQISQLVTGVNKLRLRPAT